MNIFLSAELFIFLKMHTVNKHLEKKMSEKEKHVNVSLLIKKFGIICSSLLNAADTYFDCES